MTDEEKTVTEVKLVSGAIEIDAYMVLLAEVAVTAESQAVSAFMGCPPANEVVGRYQAVVQEEIEWFTEQVAVFAKRYDNLISQYGKLTLDKLTAQSTCTVEGCQDKEAARIVLEEVLGDDDEYTQ